MSAADSALSALESPDLTEPTEGLTHVGFGAGDGEVGTSTGGGPCCFAVDNGGFVIGDVVNQRLVVLGQGARTIAAPFRGILAVDVQGSLATILAHHLESGDQYVQYGTLDLAHGDDAWTVHPREDLEVFGGSLATDQDGAVWALAGPMGPGEPQAWHRLDGEGSQEGRPLPDGSTLTTSFDRTATVVWTHDNIERRWSITSQEPLSLAAVAVVDEDLLLVVNHATDLTPSGLAHEVLRLDDGGVTRLLAMEAFNEPYIEIGGMFEFVGDRLLRLMPDGTGVAIVAYDLSP